MAILTLGQEIALAQYTERIPDFPFKDVLFAIMRNSPSVEVCEEYVTMDPVDLSGAIEQLARIIDERCVTR